MYPQNSKKTGCCPIRCFGILTIYVFLFAGLACAKAVSAQEALIVQAASKQVVLSGYTRSRAKMKVTSEVAGKVLKVNYDVGHRTGKKPFVQIDTTFINYQIEQVHATLEKLNLTKKRYQSRADFLKKEYLRIEKLRQNDVTSESSRDAAAEQLAQAQFDLMSTEVEIKNLKSQYNELLERRSRHNVAVPAGWVIVQRTVESGEIISAGSLLAQAADYTQLVIPLYVSDKELDALAQQEKLAVSMAGKKAQAKINWINPEFDERSRKLAVELIVFDYDGPYRGGLLAELPLKIAYEGLMVPKAAISRRYENPHVTLKSTGKTVPVVILSQSADHVIIAGTQHLEPGQQLQKKQ
ncbi:MAG: HlyD family efflux transporter periplasmic adaptor subunit [Desulfobacteraceae bacterium]|nr:HlyD family efflux transporter periplasmic adaptor subunit [Desulfobacteraceae bacterium]